MLIRTLFLFFSYLFAINFSLAQQTQDELNPEVKKLTFAKNSALVIKQFDGGFDHEVVKGKKWVFHYYYKAQDSKEVADDEFTEYIRFEVKPACKKFKYTAKEANLIYNRGCFCPETGNFKINIGEVTGKKISKDKWQLKITFTVEPRTANSMAVKQEKTIEGIFTIGNLNLE